MVVQKRPGPGVLILAVLLTSLFLFPVIQGDGVPKGSATDPIAMREAWWGPFDGNAKDLLKTWESDWGGMGVGEGETGRRLIVLYLAPETDLNKVQDYLEALGGTAIQAWGPWRSGGVVWVDLDLCYLPDLRLIGGVEGIYLRGKGGIPLGIPTISPLEIPTNTSVDDKVLRISFIANRHWESAPQVEVGGWPMFEIEHTYSNSSALGRWPTTTVFTFGLNLTGAEGYGPKRVYVVSSSFWGPIEFAVREPVIELVSINSSGQDGGRQRLTFTIASSVPLRYVPDLTIGGVAAHFTDHLGCQRTYEIEVADLDFARGTEMIVSGRYGEPRIDYSISLGELQQPIRGVAGYESYFLIAPDGILTGLADGPLPQPEWMMGADRETDSVPDQDEDETPFLLAISLGSLGSLGLLVLAIFLVIQKLRPDAAKPGESPGQSDRN